MGICLAIILLFDHFKCCSTLHSWEGLGFELDSFLLVALVTLEEAFHLNLNLRIQLYSLRDVRFHGVIFAHTFVVVPGSPLTPPNEIYDGRFWCITISNCSLFVQSINDEFILIRNGFRTLTDVFGGLVKDLAQYLYRLSLLTILLFTLGLLLCLLLCSPEKQFL